MATTHETTWRAGHFGWDATKATKSDSYPLRAVIFDLDALADVECDGHRVAFNAAFAAHGLNVNWSVGRYRQLLALRDEHKRVLAELRKRCIDTECDVLTERLAAQICRTKGLLADETILGAGLSPRPGLLDLVMDAFAAGLDVGVVTSGPRSWAEPLIRQLLGDGMTAAVITADDVSKPMPDREAFRNALAEFGIRAENALAISGSASGLRAATAAGLATLVVTGDGTPHIPAAVDVRPDFAGSNPLRLADCQRLHGHWWSAHAPRAA